MNRMLVNVLKFGVEKLLDNSSDIIKIIKDFSVERLVHRKKHVIVTWRQIRREGKSVNTSQPNLINFLTRDNSN